MPGQFAPRLGIWARSRGFSFTPALAFLALGFMACNSGGDGSGNSVSGISSPQAGLGVMERPATSSGGFGNTGNMGNAANSGAVASGGCASSDPNQVCLGLHFVAYQDSAGVPTVTESQAQAIVQTMNQLWTQCLIGFQLENYESVDPTKSGLDYGANSQSQVDQIRQTYGSPSNQLLAVTTGPWGTAVNAWTTMPGSGIPGAVMESSIVDYGNGIIYAHEFGHYLGLDHVSDTSNLMNALIYTNSTALTSAQCQTAQSTARGMWAAMLR